MTEREAWLEMAKIWEGAVKDEQGEWGINYQADLWDFGLCHTIARLRVAGSVTPEVADAIIDVLEMQAAMTELRAYAWPHTYAGARARVAFCRKRAALIGGDDDG